MDDLDKKLLEAIYKSISLNKLPDVPKNSTNWFKVTPNGNVYEFVIDSEAIKQAFIDAGWQQNSLAALKGVQVYKISTAELSDVEYDPAPESRYGAPLMTGQEWYDRFINELSEPYHTPRELNPDRNETLAQKYQSLGEKDMHASALAAAKKAAGIE